MNKKKKIILTIVLVLILIIIGIIYIMNNTKQTNENETYKIGQEIKLTNNIKKELYEKVKEDITSSLKSPASAIFPKMKNWNIDVNYNNVIEVNSYVDSQNSYGAMLRAEFEQRYIILNKDNYLCIYKEFDNETEFDITGNTEYQNFINKEVYDFQMEEFIEKSKNATSYGNLKNYNYNKEEQTLELNIEIFKIDSPYYKIEDYINGVIVAYINQCICIPTVTTTLNIYDKEKCIATVKNINLEFLLNDWYTLWDIGIMDNIDGTNIEEKLKDRLWISNEVK